MAIAQHAPVTGAVSTYSNTERLGSAWQGMTDWEYPECGPSGATLDLLLPQDRRVTDPAWQRWPYRMVYQVYPPAEINMSSIAVGRH